MLARLPRWPERYLPVRPDQRPYNPARPVVCLDESPKQLIRESRPPVVLPDGSTRYDAEYHRHSVVQLYRLHEPLRGWRRVQPATTGSPLLGW